MGIFEQFPYTNFHDLNLDWILHAIRSMDKKLDEFVASNVLSYADPIQWDIETQYAKNTVVIDPKTGTAYMSINPVPVGQLLTNKYYWQPIFNYDEIVNTLKKQIAAVQADQHDTIPVAVGHGGLVWVANKLYRLTKSLDAGSKIIENVNAVPITVEDAIINIDTTKNITRNTDGTITDTAGTITRKSNSIIDTANDAISVSGKTITNVAADSITNSSTNITNSATGDVSVSGKNITDTASAGIARNAVTITDTATGDVRVSGKNITNTADNISISATEDLTEKITGDKKIDVDGELYINTKNPVKYAEVITNNDNADVINMTDKNNNSYQLLVASGEFYENGKRKLTAKEYGAKGDGVTDDTAILQSILDSGEPLILTKGTYYTSKGLNATNSNVIIGDKANSVIECHNTENTIDNYIIGTSCRSTIYGVTLKYADDVTILESWPSFSFIGVRFLNTPWNGQRTNGISDSKIVHTGTGILATTEDPIFSVGFFNLEITEFQQYGMFLCGSSGCTIQNAYINNGVDNAGTQTAKLKKAYVNLVIKDTDCMNIGGLNLEWNKGTALELQNSTCFISTLHMEAIEAGAPYNGYINITNSNLHIGTLSVYYCFTNEIAGTFVIRLNEGNTPVTFDNYHGTDCSLTIDTLLLVGWGSPDWHTFPNATRGLDKATDARILFRNNNVGNYNVSINSILRVGVSQADYDKLASKSTQYYNQGTGKLYVNKWGEYNKIGVSTDKPSASNPNLYDGATYYNTDTNVTSVYYNDAWIN